MIYYTLDAEDTIVDVGGDWDQFALENGGAHCTRVKVVGNLLYRYIAGPDVVDVYRVLFARSRRTRSQIELDFRCDAPAFRRKMRMRISPEDRGLLTVTTALLDEEPRAEVSLLDSHAPRGSEFISICCICGDVCSENGEWVPVEVECQRRRLMEHATVPRLSHGFCPECLSSQLAELDARR
ncbi:MAG: hypothetical protein KF886_16115 [Candidatus Hydrogenedentes bacterium]|nr:hypothetical protein [Candidatus Hydrogenedentota bacterium]